MPPFPLFWQTHWEEGILKNSTPTVYPSVSHDGVCLLLWLRWPHLRGAPFISWNDERTLVSLKRHKSSLGRGIDSFNKKPWVKLAAELSSPVSQLNLKELCCLSPSETKLLKKKKKKNQWRWICYGSKLIAKFRLTVYSPPQVKCLSSVNSQFSSLVNGVSSHEWLLWTAPVSFPQ